MTVLHCFSMGVVALLALSAGAAKQDGVWMQPVTSDVNFSTEQYWVDGKTVADGGRVTFLNQSADSKKAITVDKADRATWGGASFGSGCFVLSGLALTLTGDGVLEVATGGAPKLENDVTLASGSRMTKRGGGSLTFGGVVSGGTLVLEDGALVVTNPVLPTCALKLAAGRFTWSPSAAANAVLESSVPSLTYGPDRVRFKVVRGNAASSAVTFDALASSAEGGFLELIGSGPVSGFGTTERFLVKGRPSDAGYIDASVVSRGAANADDALSFLVYDAEKGFVAAPEADFVAGQTADGKVAVIREAMTISQDASVSALRIENGAEVTIASGVTLTVGDGVHPAGVIFRESKAAKGTQRNFHGPGTLAFKSGAPGFLYFNLSCVNGYSNWTDPARLYFKDKIRFTGDCGITFAGVAGDLKDYGSFAWSAAQIGWTGGTSVLGVRLQGVLDKLPAPLRILGESSEGFGGQVRQNNDVSPAQVLTLSGTGSSSAGHGGVFSSGGSPSVRFTGKVTLANDVTFSADNKCAADKGTQSFYGGLTGPGGIFIGNNASVDLGGPCDYAGKTELVGFGSWYIVHGPDGTPGVGPVVNTTQSDAPIRFIGHDGLVTSNDITTVGLLSVESSTNVTFLGRVSAAKGSLCDGAVIGCGTNAVNFGAFDSDGSMAFVAGADGGVAQLGISGTDLKVGAVFRDGDGGRRLGIDKVASDVVTLYGASSNSGAVVVHGGTLRLSQDVFTSPDISYWLDASDASTIETDGSGRVTKWSSKCGVAGVAFVPPPAATGLPYCGPTVSEGMVDFTLADYTRLVATNVQTATALPNLTQRTVFVVTRPRTADLGVSGSSFGLFGWWKKDVGQRWGASGWNVNGYTEGTAATFDTCRGLRLDGQLRGQGTSASGSLPSFSYRNDELQVVTMRHELDYDVSTAWGVIKTRAVFPPALGGYFPGPEASSYSRGYNGEIAEVIAFRRLLSEAEMRLVENYLGEKWGIALSHGSETAELPPVLGGEAPLEVCAGAVLDLNGVDATVASLAGSGLITNSAATAAKLVVSGANSFRGVIGGAVTLVTQGEDAGSGYLLRDGAGLAVDGGTSVAGTFADGLVTNGIVYWVDASRPETVRTNAAGNVTNWICRAGAVKSFVPSDGKPFGGQNIVYTPPERYDEHVAAFCGKPGVYFGGSTKNTGSNELWTSSETTTRTLFLVCSCDGQPDGQSGFWGAADGERGMVINSWSKDGTKWNVRQYTGTTYHRYGRLLRATGPDGASVDYTWATNDRDWPMPATFVLAAQNDDASGNISSYKNRTFTLGRVYHRGTKAWYGEVIGYDRVLSAEEVRSVERYLRNKWFASASVEPVPSVTPGTPVAVANGGRLDFAGQDVSVSTLHAGDGTLANFGLLTIADAIELELDAAGCVIPLTLAGDVVFGGAGRTIPVSIAGGAQPARSPSVQEAVRVTGGTVTGDLVKDAALRRVSLNRTGDVWSFSRLGMTVVVR